MKWLIAALALAGLSIPLIRALRSAGGSTGSSDSGDTAAQAWAAYQAGYASIGADTAPFTSPVPDPQPDAPGPFMSTINAAEDSIVKTVKQTLGLSINNPGNLRPWKVDQPASKGFRVFDSAQAGLDELARQLLVYAKQGKNSVQAIVTTYAPASENDTAAYISAVSRSLGVSPTAPLDLHAAGTLSQLMAAVVTHEQGANPFSSTQLDAIAAQRIALGTSTSAVV